MLPSDLVVHPHLGGSIRKITAVPVHMDAIHRPRDRMATSTVFHAPPEQIPVFIERPLLEPSNPKKLFS